MVKICSLRKSQQSCMAGDDDYGIDDFDTKPNQDQDNGVKVDDDVDVQGGEWEEDEDEPHLAYPGPHARGQVT